MQKEVHEEVRQYAKQLWQEVEELAPTIVDHVPALQFKQNRWLFAEEEDEYVPAGQLTQIGTVAKLLNHWPGLHSGIQLLEEVETGEDVNPALHEMHWLEEDKPDKDDQVALKQKLHAEILVEPATDDQEPA